MAVVSRGRDGNWLRHGFSRHIRFGALAAAVAALVACNTTGAPAAPNSAATQPAQLPKVTVGVLTGSAGLAPFYIALNDGLFQKWGVEPVPVYTGAFPELEAGLQSNSLDISEIGDMFRDYEKGLHYVGLIGTDFGSSYFDLVCNPSVDATSGTADDKLHALRGKKIAMSGIGSPPYIQLAAALKNHNMTIDDVTIVNIQVGAPEYAAMQAQQVDCMVGNPNDVAFLTPADGRYQALNFGDPGVVPDLVAKASGAWVARADWVPSHPKEVGGFQHAWAEAELRMMDPNNLSEAEAAIQQAIGKNAATGPALETETRAVIASLTPVWGEASAQDVYNADLADGVLTQPIDNFNARDFVAPGAPASQDEARQFIAAAPH